MVFKDKVVLVTGASSGIGEAVARRAASAGAAVALLVRRRDRLKVVAADIEQQGGTALAVTCDVTSDESVRAACAAAREQLGPPAVVIAGAGFEVTGTLESLSIADYRRQFETNVFGVLRTVYATLDDLKQTKGRLAIIGSLLGHIVLPGTTAYSMSKFALTALAEGLRLELEPFGIRVVLISPGNVSTEIRRIDNFDRLHADVPDPIPAWLRITPDRAAREILTAITRGERERVITGLGKVAVAVERHLPELVSLAIAGARLHGRPASTGPRHARRTRAISK